MKRHLLFGALAAASITVSALAARPVSVQVDGELLRAGSYVDRGVTYVPLRDLLDTLGGWSVWWDSGRALAAAESQEGVQLTADPASGTLSVDGETYSARVTVEKGRTFVPLRLTAEALGGGAEWDPYLDGAAITSAGADYDASDFYWLSRIIHAESGGEPLRGQVAVGSVVLNRVESEEFPDNIPDVIFDRTDAVQFEPVANATVYNAPTKRSEEAAGRALDGERPVGGAMYFYAPALSQGVWINANRKYLMTIGCHRFYL